MVVARSGLEAIWLVFSNYYYFYDSRYVSTATDAAPAVADGSPEEEDDAGTPITSDAGPRPRRQARANKQYAGPSGMCSYKPVACVVSCIEEQKLKTES